MYESSNASIKAEIMNDLIRHLQSFLFPCSAIIRTIYMVYFGGDLNLVAY